MYVYASVSIYIYLRKKGNGKRKFVLLGLKSINSNQQLLFQQICPSMHVGIPSAVPVFIV